MDEGENAKDEEGEGSLQSIRGVEGANREWMVLFMRTDFCSDIATTLIARKKGRVF